MAKKEAWRLGVCIALFALEAIVVSGVIFRTMPLRFIVISFVIFAAVAIAYGASITLRHTSYAVAAISAIVAIAHAATEFTDVPFANASYHPLLGPTLVNVPVSAIVFLIAACLAAIIIAEPPITDRHLGTGALIDWTFDAAVFVTLVDVVLVPVLVSLGLVAFRPSAWTFLSVPYQQPLGTFVVACLASTTIIFAIPMSRFTRTSYAIAGAFFSAVLIALGIAAIQNDLVLIWITAFSTASFLIVQSILRFRR